MRTEDEALANSFRSMSDSFAFEGGDKETKKGSPEKPKELTPEEKEEKKKRDELSKNKAKEMLLGYVKKFKSLMIWGFVLNLLGMVGEFLSPLFIGWVVDAIVQKDMARVRELIVYFMIMNGVSTHVLFLTLNYSLRPFSLASKGISSK